MMNTLTHFINTLADLFNLFPSRCVCVITDGSEEAGDRLLHCCLGFDFQLNDIHVNLTSAPN